MKTLKQLATTTFQHFRCYNLSQSVFVWIDLTDQRDLMLVFGRGVENRDVKPDTFCMQTVCKPYNILHVYLYIQE